MLLADLLLSRADQEYLHRFITSKQRPHSLLLDISQAGLDERVLPSLAEYALCLQPQSAGACGQCSSCRSLKVQAHPDLQILQPAGKAGIIKLEQVKQLLEKLAYAPRISKLKVIIILNVERLNKEAANSLLKNLKEPDGERLFLFTTENCQAVLPTILSRTLQWRLQKNDSEAVYQSLALVEGTELQKRACVLLAELKPQLARLYLQEESLQLRELALEILTASAQRKLLLVANKLNCQQISKREQLQLLNTFLQFYLRDLLLLQNGCGQLLYNIDRQLELRSLQTSFTGEQLHGYLQFLQRQEKMLALNISVKLLVDDLCIYFD